MAKKKHRYEVTIISNGSKKSLIKLLNEIKSCYKSIQKGEDELYRFDLVIHRKI